MSSRPSHVSWSRIAQDTEECTELDEPVRKRGLWAIDFLQSELGKDFFDRPGSDRACLYTAVYNTAPWTRQWLIWLADALRRARESVGYRSLHRRLLDSERAGEALSVLEVADEFLLARLQVAFDPESPDGSRRVPDLVVRTPDRRERLYVEITDQDMPQSYCEGMDLTRRVIWPLLTASPRILYAGRLSKVPTPEEEVVLAAGLQKAVRDSRAQQAVRSLCLPGLAEIAVAPEALCSDLQDWASGRGLNAGDFAGPPAPVDELPRVARKVRDKKTQLPPDFPGLVVLGATALLAGRGLRAIDTLACGLDKRLRKAPQVMAVVVRCQGRPGTLDHLVQLGNGWFAVRQRLCFFPDEYYLIPNPHCTVAAPLRILARLRSGFIQGSGPYRFPAVALGTPAIDASIFPQR